MDGDSWGFCCEQLGACWNRFLARFIEGAGVLGVGVKGISGSFLDAGRRPEASSALRIAIGVGSTCQLKPQMGEVAWQECGWRRRVLRGERNPGLELPAMQGKTTAGRASCCRGQARR